MSKATILVTRPEPAGSALCHVLNGTGCETILLPTIAYAPPSDLAAMESGVKQLGEQDWVVFISPQSVFATVPLMRREWPTLPPVVKFAAVGLGTAKVLNEAGYNAIYPSQEWSSEGLLAMPAFNDVVGKRIAIVRGVGGRELLEPVLADRGAIVTPVITYQRVVPEADISNCMEMFLQKRIDAVVCTSSTSVVNFKKMIGDDGWQAVNTVPMIVISERIKKIAQDLGFKIIWVAKNASHQAIAETIKEVSYDRE